MDEDAELKKQAGFDDLTEYSNFYEIKTCCKLFNCTQSELFTMDDGFVTKMLLGEKINGNFESKFIALKHEHSK